MKEINKNANASFINEKFSPTVLDLIKSTMNINIKMNENVSDKIQVQKK